MSQYNFLNLSPIDFEDLSRDLLQKHLNVYIESFTIGRDQGIDLRYSLSKNLNCVIQCKRYDRYSSLKANLLKEKEKIFKLKPSKYILVTSVGLTPNNKEEIRLILQELPIGTNDIFGRNDINNLLSQYPEIEKNHFKLWLPSTSLLNRFLHNDIYLRSEFDRSDIEHIIKVYVYNKSFEQAVEILNKYNYLIISGIPGIGKTILAKILIYNYLVKNNVEFMYISSDISEAEKVFVYEKEQVFFYDDFLGTNFLSTPLIKNEDKRIIKFLDRIRNSKNKKFILTTREYILNQAKQKFEQFNNDEIDLGKCIIDLSDYTKLIRAKILYNHLYYSELPYEYTIEIIKNKRYKNIIDHRNYNPRIIEFMTKNIFIEKIKKEDFYSEFKINLDNPTKIWEHVFLNQISEDSRCLLLVLLSCGTPITRTDLMIAYRFFLKASELSIANSNLDFINRCLRELENSFVKIHKVHENDKLNDNVYISFQNPSIQDFLINYLNSNRNVIKTLLEGSYFFNQLYQIYSFDPNDKRVNIDEEMGMIIMKKLRDYNSMKLSLISSSFSSNPIKYFHDHNSLTRIKRIYNLAKLFKPYNNLINSFIIDEFAEMESQENMENSLDVDSYINLISLIGNSVMFNGINMMERLIKSDSITSWDELKSFLKFREIFPEEFYILKVTEPQDLSRLVENVIDNEWDNIRLSDDIDELEDFIENIEAMKKIFSFSHFHFIEKANERINDIEHENENRLDLTPSYSNRDTIVSNEDILIESMFTTILERF